jgi:hypothetical protein
MTTILRRFLRALAAALLVPVLLFEEWGWEPLAAMVGRLARLPFWARVEAAIRRLPPWAALTTILAPVLLLLPIKLLGLFLLGEGYPLAALCLILGAKLVGTAIVARLFQLVEPALMHIRVFARWYPRWKGWKNSLLDRARQSAIWRATRVGKATVRRWWRNLRRA